MSCGTVRPAALELSQEIEALGIQHLAGPFGLRRREPEIAEILEAPETRQLGIQMALQAGEDPDRVAAVVVMLAMARLQREWDAAVGLASLRPEDLPG